MFLPEITMILLSWPVVRENPQQPWGLRLALSFFDPRFFIFQQVPSVLLQLSRWRKTILILNLHIFCLSSSLVLFSIGEGKEGIKIELLLVLCVANSPPERTVCTRLVSSSPDTQYRSLALWWWERSVSALLSTVATSHVWLMRSWNVASATEELNFF